MRENNALELANQNVYCLSAANTSYIYVILTFINFNFTKLTKCLTYPSKQHNSFLTNYNQAYNFASLISCSFLPLRYTGRFSFQFGIIY